jgi:CRP-like cAMP-binding protein
VIDKGLLGVVKNVGQPEQVTLFTIGSGDFVDELGFMDGTEHYASLVSLGETRVLGLERETLESLLGVHPDIVYKVMRSIIRAVHQIQRRLSMQSVELSNYIYKQHGKY